MILARSLLLVTTLGSWSLALPAQEIEVPEFHTEKAKASYVLAVPPKHDKKKSTPLILDFHGAAAPTSREASTATRSVR